MDKFRNQVEKEQNILERIVEYIPGYRSYRQRERRRDIDKALRTYVAGKVHDFMNALSHLSKFLTDAGKIDVLDDIDNLYRRLEGVADKIKLATYGYAGFFDVIKVREDELDALYQFDLKLLDAAHQMNAMLDPAQEKALINDSPLLAERLNAIEIAVRNLEKLMLDRTNLILNVKGLPS